MTMKKLVLVTAAAACFASLPAQAQQKHAVNQVVATVSFAFLPVYVAEHSGFFAQEGVDLKTTTVSTAQAGLAAVASGNAAYYLSTPAAGARSAAQGARVTNCGALMTQNPTNIVVSADVAKKFNIRNPAQIPVWDRLSMLKGLRLAAHTAGSSPDITLRYALRQVNMSPESDVQVLPIVQDAILAALEQKRIDGFAYSSPLADIAVAKHGAVTLISFADGEYRPLAGHLSISMVCSKDWLEKQPDAAAAALRAIWRGMRLMQSDPAKARAAAKKAFANLEDSIFDMAFETNRKAFPDNPTISRSQMEVAIDFHHKTGGAPITVKVEETFTNAAVERAAKTLR
jgi:NitT/TauT family transport system substrate-binding protein